MIIVILLFRKGLAFESVLLMMKFSFDKYQINHFVAIIKDENIASLNLFEKKLSFNEISHSSFFKEKTLEIVVSEEYFKNFQII